MHEKYQYLTIQQPSTKIVIAGDKEEVENFISLCKPDDILHRETITINGFTSSCSRFYQKRLDNKVYELMVMDLTRLSYTNYIEDYMTEASAIIYLNPTAEQLALVEEKRDDKKCIAINFHSLKLEPIDCLSAISNLSRIHPHLIEKFNQAKDKALLVYLSRVVAKSAFFNLPLEIKHHINQLMLESLVTFSISNKPVYVALLPEKEMNALLIQASEDKNRSEKGTCLII